MSDAEFRRRLRIAADLQHAGVRVDPRLIAHLARQPVWQASLARRVIPAVRQQTRRAARATKHAGRTVATELRMLVRIATVAVAIVFAIRVFGPFSLVTELPPGDTLSRTKSSAPPSGNPSLDALLDELEAALAAAPLVVANPSASSSFCAGASFDAGGAADDVAHHRITDLTAKLERFANSHGVRVDYLPHCPVERNQQWVGLYEPKRIRICPYPPAGRFGILLHETAHLLQDKVFRRNLDQHEADAISWIVQRQLGLPVELCTVEHMRFNYNTKPRDIRARRKGIKRGAEIILEALE